MKSLRVRRGVRLVSLCALVLGSGLSCARDATGPLGDYFCRTRPGAALVTFEDPNLEEAIRGALPDGPPSQLTCGLVETVTELTAGDAGIESLSGIENLTGLTTLWIRANEISDISPLAGLKSLTRLNLADNSISDVSALRGLTNLTFLAINLNKTIEDISPLSGLTKLSGTLWIHSNSISDLRALSGLTGLTTLNAWDNKITELTGLSGLTGLKEIRVHMNAITDVSSLRDLPNLQIVWLSENPDLSDIRPLLDNSGVGSGTSVNISSTSAACDDVDVLRARGVSVISACP